MNINSLLLDYNRRLSDIYRFNTLPRIHLESVAEHCFYVSFYVMILADELMKNNQSIKIDKEKALSLALIHDIEETVSSDFPNTTKTKYPKFTEHLEEMNQKIVSDIFDNDEKYIKLWNEVRKANTVESTLVHFADQLSVYLYTRDEAKLGNMFMSEVYNLQKRDMLVFMMNHPEYLCFKGILS